MADDEEEHSRSKGKARATDVSERTPLLASPAATDLLHQSDDLEATPRVRRRLSTKLLTVFVSSLAICLVILLFVVALVYSYGARAYRISPEAVMHRGLVLDGPDRVNLVNMSSDGVLHIQVEGRIGLDIGAVMGFNSDEERDGIWTSTWKAWGRWGVQRLDRVSVKLSDIQITSVYKPLTDLAHIELPEIELPLTTDPPSDLSWLTDVSISVLVRPTTNMTDILEFTRMSWKEGSASIRALVQEVTVRGGSLNDESWRRKLHVVRSDVRTVVQMAIPTLPGLPTPGHGAPFPPVAKLVTLESFNLSSSSGTLFITAKATAPNPLPESLSFLSPPMTSMIYLPPPDNSPSTDAIPFASINIHPFNLTHPNISIPLTGALIPLSPNSSQALSNFLTLYLAGRSPPIIVTAPNYPSLKFATVFPPPNPRPHVLRDVTIRDMHVRAGPPTQRILSSGIIFARVVLPKGMRLGVDVNRVLPDVLVFDGDVPNLVVSNPPLEDDMQVAKVPKPPLPDPLPEGAFARVRPDDWLEAQSVPDEEDTGAEGTAVIVTARFEDVPLEVIPGREAEFRRFLAKVVFGTKGALAGVQGTAAVSAHVDGLPINSGGDNNSGNIELWGLPFKGRVRVGKKGLLSDEVDVGPSVDPW